MRSSLSWTDDAPCSRSIPDIEASFSGLERSLLEYYLGSTSICDTSSICNSESRVRKYVRGCPGFSV